MNLTTEYSVWFIPLCLLVGVAYGAILYYRNTRDELPASLKRWLFALRTVAVSFIVFLLLGPMIKNAAHKNVKPVIAIATDASLSMNNALNPQQRQQLFDDIKKLDETLSSRFDVQYLAFGSTVLNQPCDSFYMPSTNMGNLFDVIDAQYKHSNLGAVIVISDGINNEGKDPLYAATPIETSIYTVGVGDTTQIMDLSIANVVYNKNTYKGNHFPIQIMLQGEMASGAKTNLLIKHNDRILEERPVNINGNRFFHTQVFYIKADSAGLYRYRLEFVPIENEANSYNNYKEIAIEVLDRKQSALIVAGAPHPDVGMLQGILEKASFRVESCLSTRVNHAAVKDFDIVILHSLPSLRDQADALLKTCSEMNIPILFIMGNNTNFSQFNALQTGLAITQQSNLKEHAVPVLNRSFSLFLQDNSTADDYSQLPPLIAPFGDYKMANSASVLFYQKIGSVETNYPLVAFNNTLTGRYGFICGEGIWRWRLDAARRTGNSNAVENLITKSVQLLISDDKNKRFKVYCEKEYTSYDRVMVRAELYNQARELTTEEEVTFDIRDEQGNDYNYVFGVERNNYKLDAGNFPSGVYQWRASVKIGVESFAEQGTFTVLSSDLELEQTTANHRLLMNLAELHDGAFFPLPDINQLTDALQQRTDLKPVRISVTDYFSLINLAWLLFVLLAMLFAEWFLRKFFGSY
ncbi:MAG: hypothetical protein FWG84_04425 [Bacteroidales bacterium]|nr:hypothetical protein [Bacteroidales bacterium]